MKRKPATLQPSKRFVRLSNVQVAVVAVCASNAASLATFLSSGLLFCLATGTVVGAFVTLSVLLWRVGRGLLGYMTSWAAQGLYWGVVAAGIGFFQDEAQSRGNTLLLWGGIGALSVAAAGVCVLPGVGIWRATRGTWRAWRKARAGRR
jgi:hypothetical protein